MEERHCRYPGCGECDASRRAREKKLRKKKNADRTIKSSFLVVRRPDDAPEFKPMWVAEKKTHVLSEYATLEGAQAEKKRLQKIGIWSTDHGIVQMMVLDPER